MFEIVCDNCKYSRKLHFEWSIGVDLNSIRCVSEDEAWLITKDKQLCPICKNGLKKGKT